MIKMQGKNIANKGVAPGAVVTVQCDYHAVSHSIGIVGVVYEVSKFGGARIATIAGIYRLVLGRDLMVDPSISVCYEVRCKQGSQHYSTIDADRDAILAGTYNINNSAPKCTIQEADQQITQVVSPCRKSKCGCKGGACKAGHCGCIKKGFKCTSVCPCNGNCTANPNNGK
jgi:hypothetical protein